MWIICAGRPVLNPGGGGHKMMCGTEATTQFSVPFEVIACLASQVCIKKKLQQFGIFWFAIKYFPATCRRIQRQMCGRCWNKRHLDKMSLEEGEMWSASEIASLTFDSVKMDILNLLQIQLLQLDVDSLLTLVFYTNASGSRPWPWNTPPWTQRLSGLLDKLYTVNEKSNYLFSPATPTSLDFSLCGDLYMHNTLASPSLSPSPY